MNATNTGSIITECNGLTRLYLLDIDRLLGNRAVEDPNDQISPVIGKTTLPVRAMMIIGRHMGMTAEKQFLSIVWAEATRYLGAGVFVPSTTSSSEHTFHLFPEPLLRFPYIPDNPQTGLPIHDKTPKLKFLVWMSDFRLCVMSGFEVTYFSIAGLLSKTQEEVLEIVGAPPTTAGVSSSTTTSTSPALQPSAPAIDPQFAGLLSMMTLPANVSAVEFQNALVQNCITGNIQFAHCVAVDKCGIFPPGVTNAFVCQQVNLAAGASSNTASGPPRKLSAVATSAGVFVDAQIPPANRRTQETTASLIGRANYFPIHGEQIMIGMPCSPNAGDDCYPPMIPPMLAGASFRVRGRTYYGPLMAGYSSPGNPFSMLLMFDADAMIPVADVQEQGYQFRWIAWVGEELPNEDGGEGPFAFLADESRVDQLFVFDGSQFPQGRIARIDGSVRMLGASTGTARIDGSVRMLGASTGTEQCSIGTGTG